MGDHFLIEQDLVGLAAEAVETEMIYGAVSRGKPGTGVSRLVPVGTEIDSGGDGR